MVGMMQALGALPIVGPGAVAAGGDSTWGPTASSRGGAGLARREPGHAAAASSRRSRTRTPTAAGALVDTDPFVDHSPGWGTKSFASVLETQATLRAAMPDLSYELDTTCMVCEGDEVAGHSVVRGTHTGEPLFGAEPSGNEVVWTHSDFVRLAGGKIVERWTATDLLTLFQQAGVLPSHGGWR